MNKEKVFVSAIVCMKDCEEMIPFFSKLYQQLSKHFEHFEIIAVDNCCPLECSEKLRKLSADFQEPLTIIHLSMNQGKESAMNAGLDAAIGDYLYQFEIISENFDFSILWQAYQKMNGIYDIVTVGVKPTKNKFFYHILNSDRNIEVGTELFSIITRRVLNRVHAVSEYLTYRKAAFATCGLKSVSIICKDDICIEDDINFSLSVESILIYTRLGYKLSINTAILFLLLAFIELIYIVVVFCVGKPIEGWTTITAFMTFGFFGVFLMMAVIIKYLSMIIEFLCKKQKYLINSIEKIQK